MKCPWAGTFSAPSSSRCASFRDPLTDGFGVNPTATGCPDCGKAFSRRVEHSATVILLKVPNDVNAYKMFETLNDRGLRTSQADLVKNYLFGQSGSRLGEAQQKWALMSGAGDYGRVGDHLVLVGRF